MRRLILCGALRCLFAVSFASPASAVVLSGDIAPQSLAQALTAFAEQTGLQLFYFTAIAETQQSRGARAGMSPSAALAQLLEGTGLQFTFVNARAVRIVAPPGGPASFGHGPRAATFPQSAHNARRATLEEVVVTATRREERAGNVPISMIVWSQDAMEASGIKGIDEIGALTPGVEFGWDTGVSQAFTSLVIRGVTDMHGPTTGVYIDNTPVPIATSVTLGRAFPWAFDLDRVEVLRGSQGTLLGQGTLGGAVRFIMNQPSLTTFTGLARTEFSTMAHGGEGYEAGFAAGGPLVTNILGFRVSGWYQQQGGFVDRINPLNGATVEANANRQTNRSFRGALTWAPIETVSITPSLNYESFRIRDTPAFYMRLSNPKVGELKNGSLVQQPFSDVFYLASVTLKAHLTIADLDAVTSDFHRTGYATFDWGPEQPVSYADAVAMPADIRQRMFSQEVRLTSAKSDAPLSWIAGVFYSSARKRVATTVVPALGPVEYANATVIDQTQLEGFGHIGLRLANRLTSSAGLRIGRTAYDAVTEAPMSFRAGVAETSVTPRFELSYQTDAGNLWYLSAAKGYRSGGFDVPIPLCDTTPSRFLPDTVWSYEVGAKRDLLAGRVHVEPSVFHIKWRNQQADPLDLSCGRLPFPASTAASNGFDLAAQVVVTERVKVSLTLAYTDARYTQTLKIGDAVIVRKGDVLGGFGQTPSPWNATTAIEYKRAVTGGVAVDMRAEDTFHSRSPGPFATDDPAYPSYTPALRPDPSTNELNLRAGLRWPSYELTLFANNALNAQPTVMRNIVRATTFRPRTIGLSATWRFDRSPRSD